MLITAILTSAFVFLLFYQGGALGASLWLLGGLSIAVGGLLYCFGRHGHGSMRTLDVIARQSRLQTIHTNIRCAVSLALLLLCVISPQRATGLVVFALCLTLTVWVGGLHLHDYLSLLCVPLSFLLLSCLAILFELSPTPQGVLAVPLFGFGQYLCITPQTQQTALTLCIKALGALSCLYVLNLSTTMSQIIATCKRVRLPALIIELMYLMYRYIFILDEVHRQMVLSANSRLGFAYYRQSVRTTGAIYANLLAQSFRKASQCFDAMESRAYTGEIAFLESEPPIRWWHVMVFASLFCLVCAISWFASY